MKKIVLATVISLMAASTSFATSMYVKGGLGYSFAVEASVEYEDVTLSNYLESGPFFMGAFGLNISPMVAAELEISYRENDNDNVNTSFGVLNFAVNGLFNIPLEGLPIVPYFGGGLTLGNYSVENKDMNLDESAFGVGLQFFGGASFMIQDNLYIGADLRYALSIMDPELKIAEDGSKAKYSVSHLGLLANIQFLF